MSSDQSTANNSRKQQAEDDFETVSPEDAGTTGQIDGKSTSTTKDDLSLTRIHNRNQDEDDDSDDDEHAMAHHPIFGMLAGRLGQRRRGSAHKYDKLHPENQVLSLTYVDDCVEVENAAFPENERASREKVMHFHSYLSGPI